MGKNPTWQLYERLRDILTARQLEDDLPKCFFNIRYGQQSTTRYREIFGNESKRSILDCTLKEINALSNLSGIPPSELIHDFGMGLGRLTGQEMNIAVKDEGFVWAPVMHAA